MASREDLLESVVRATRLNKLIAPYTVARLLIKAGVNPKHLDPAAVEKALPTFAEGLPTFLPSDEVEAALAELRTLARD